LSAWEIEVAATLPLSMIRPRPEPQDESRFAAAARRVNRPCSNNSRTALRRNALLEPGARYRNIR
jgi:hypothetical protein